MTRIQLCSTLIMMLLASLLSCDEPTPTDDVARVRACYDAYIAALKEGRGTDAAALVDSRTVMYYDSMISLALNADSVTITELSVMDQITVLGFRLHNRKEPLIELDGREALAVVIDGGMFGRPEMDGFDIGAIEVQDAQANAPVMISGFRIPVQVEFRVEKGQWRIDITSLFDLSRIAFGQHMSTGDLTHEAQIAEMLLGPGVKKLPEWVWRPTQ